MSFIVSPKPDKIVQRAAADAQFVSALDLEYQAAVARLDADTMERILADDFVRRLGDGDAQTKAGLLADIREHRVHYEFQIEAAGTQTVRVWGDTAVVTALLLSKGTFEGTPFEHRRWFSDTYVRTPAGWKYIFGQASLPLPEPKS